MAYGIASPGRSPERAEGSEAGFRSMAEYRDLIRQNVRQGLVDIMLMSVSTNELLTIRERIFDGSPVTPAIRANDTTEIHAARGASYPREASRPFRTAWLDHAQCGQICPDELPAAFGANLGLYSITFNNDVALDVATLEAYKAFRIEAEVKGFRHFLEVFDPNAATHPVPPEELGHFVNDLVVRALAGVATPGRPVFLKMVYHGPKAMEELAHYDPHLVPGILGGSAGTTHDAFKLLAEAKKSAQGGSLRPQDQQRRAPARVHPVPAMDRRRRDRPGRGGAGVSWNVAGAGHCAGSAAGKGHGAHQRHHELRRIGKDDFRRTGVPPVSDSPRTEGDGCRFQIRRRRKIGANPRYSAPCRRLAGLRQNDAPAAPGLPSPPTGGVVRFCWSRWPHLPGQHANQGVGGTWLRYQQLAVRSERVERTMNVDATVARFTAMSERQQATALARLAHELTVLTRETYGDGPSDITNGALLRRIKELQHRVTAGVVERLSEKRERFPDEVLVRMIADGTHNPLANSTGPIFERILASAKAEVVYWSSTVVFAMFDALPRLVGSRRGSLTSIGCCQGGADGCKCPLREGLCPSRVKYIFIYCY